MDSLRWLSKFGVVLIRYDLRRAVLLFALLVSTSVLQSVSILFILPLLEQIGIDFGSTQTDTSTQSLPVLFAYIAKAASNIPVSDPLIAILLLFGALLLLRDGLAYKQSILEAKFRAGFEAELRSTLYGRLVQAPWGAISTLKSHEISFHLTTNVLMVSQACYLAVLVANAALLTVAYGAVALYAAPLLVLVFAPIGLILIFPLRRLFRAAWLQTIEAHALSKDHEDRGQNFVKRFRHVSSFGNQESESVNQANTAAQIAIQTVRIAKTQALARLLQSLIASSVLIALVWLALRAFSVPSENLILLFLAAARLFPRLVQVQNQGQSLLLLMSSFKSHVEFENRLQLAGPVPDAKPMEIASIELHGLQIEERLHLAPSSALTLERGMLTCLTGPTGSGKSTLCDVLCGLLPGIEGALVNGLPLEQCALPAYRRGVTYLEQNSVVWQNTVREALLWAKPDASEQEMMDLIEALGLSHRILDHAHGLDAPIGDSGHWLSGGELKRLALAQALLRETPVLVLDEFTANLDEETEAQIMDLIAQFKSDRIIVCATHRPGPLVHADRIFHLNGTEASKHTLRPISNTLNSDSGAGEAS